MNTQLFTSVAEKMFFEKRNIFRETPSNNTPSLAERTQEAERQINASRDALKDQIKDCTPEQAESLKTASKEEVVGYLNVLSQNRQNSDIILSESNHRNLLMACMQRAMQIILTENRKGNPPSVDGLPGAGTKKAVDDIRELYKGKYPLVQNSYSKSGFTKGLIEILNVECSVSSIDQHINEDVTNEANKTIEIGENKTFQLVNSNDVPNITLSPVMRQHLKNRIDEVCAQGCLLQLEQPESRRDQNGVRQGAKLEGKDASGNKTIVKLADNITLDTCIAVQFGQETYFYAPMANGQCISIAMINGTDPATQTYEAQNTVVNPETAFEERLASFESDDGASLQTILSEKRLQIELVDGKFAQYKNGTITLSMKESTADEDTREVTTVSIPKTFTIEGGIFPSWLNETIVNTLITEKVSA